MIHLCKMSIIEVVGVVVEGVVVVIGEVKEAMNMTGKGSDVMTQTKLMVNLIMI